MSIKAMKQALEALETKGEHHERVYTAMKTLRQAIADAEKQYGWVLREVYFEGGEPLAHREPQESTLQEMSDIGQEIEQELVACECHRCIKENNLRDGAFPLSSTKMVLCHECGNKRCPKASDHRLACTGSNESGQAGSIYTAPPKRENELDIAERAYFAGKQAGIAECEAVKREWVSLTMEDIDDAWRSLAILSDKGLQELRREYARAIEAKLREKNT
jgi:hypothetical protein